MTQVEAKRIVKVLTPNDVGDTHSHQAGWTVPKPIVSFFPPLDSSRLNPDTWLLVLGPGGQCWSWRYIYYNSRLHGLGTRNEYRLTHVRSAIHDLGASAGDVIEFTRQGDQDIHVRILNDSAFRMETDRGIIDLRGPSRWFVGDIRIR
jgi:hypothetical protein